MHRATTLRESSNEFKHPVHPLEKEFKGQLRVCVYVYIIYIHKLQIKKFQSISELYIGYWIYTGPTTNYSVMNKFLRSNPLLAISQFHFTLVGISRHNERDNRSKIR